MENDSTHAICPVCNKEVNVTVIEKHVDRCLFLNSDTKASCSVKRCSTNDDVQYYDEEGNMTPKRSKTSSEKGTSQFIRENKSLQSKEDSKFLHELPNGITSSSKSSVVPLAEQMRPSCLNDYVGQIHVLGHNKILRCLLQQNDIPSMILWGPPGCGKTSLANVISKQCQTGKTKYRFVKLSATMAGVNDVKEAVKIAKNELTSFKRQTILFMDEIHRFNKLQQDIFLPHVESGCITLIGATTENPSFSLNSALLSRCRVIVLEKLSTPNLLEILYRSIHHVEGIVVKSDEKNKTDKMDARFEIDEDTVLWLAEMCDGDARIGLNSLQMAVDFKANDTSTSQITLDDIKDGIKRSHLLYDRKGDQHYDTISALHKSIRGSDDSAALYWLARMLEGGEDPLFIARRLVVCASEDIGIKDSSALPLAVSAMQACKMIGMPECGLFLAHVTTYLSRAPKSREVYEALNDAKRCITEHKGSLPAVPLHLRNAPTKLMRNLGYGAGYKMANTVVGERTYMPEGMAKVNFFKS